MLLELKYRWRQCCQRQQSCLTEFGWRPLFQNRRGGLVEL